MNGLFGSPVLEVGIGLAFVYVLLSLMCTTLNEWLLSYFLRLRPKLLDRALDSLLSNQGMVDGNLRGLFARHPLIAKTTTSAGQRAPSYLSAATFATAILDLVTPTVQGVISFTDVEAGVKELPEGDVKKTLIALMADTGGELNKLRRNIEDWFDEAMDRTTGVFKRDAQAWAIVVAALLTLLTNADTLAIGQKLWENPSLRAEAVKLAEQRAEMPRPTVTVEYRDPDDPLNPSIAKEPQDSLTADEQSILGKLIGWEKPLKEYSVGDLLRHLPGWFLTAVAVSLGAPFWFDVLNKFMKLRNAGRVPPKGKEQEEEPSK
jgi:hypothetical protein